MLVPLLPTDVQVLILPPSYDDGSLSISVAVARTRRSLIAAGIPEASIHSLTPGGGTPMDSGPALILRAGAWLARDGPLRFPPASNFTRPLAGVGLPLAITPRQTLPTAESVAWNEIQANTGGDFNQHSTLPLPAAMVLNDAARQVFGAAWRASNQATMAWDAVQYTSRMVRWAGIDVFTDDRIRVLQLITSLQRGGAERMALDLTQELLRQGTPAWMIGLGRPTRPAFAPPPGWFDLAGRNSRTQQEIIWRLAIHFGADLFHAHLIEADVAAELAAGVRGLAWPLVQTIHNTTKGWPEGLANRLANESAPHSAFFACSRIVEAELQATRTQAFIRTIWNGIDSQRFALTEERRRELRDLCRSKYHIRPHDLVLLAIANPRPQKRLERLPPIIAACDRKLMAHGTGGGSTHLILVGSAGKGSSSGAESIVKLEAAAQSHQTGSRLHRVGDTDDVVPWLAAADVLVNVSDHEGLSLAQLEALAAGVPIVATDVGGASEIAARTRWVTLLPVTAQPDEFATAILASSGRSGISVPTTLNEGNRCLPDSFTLPVMTARHRFHYERLLAARSVRSSPRSGLWLLTNNFSTGGAQSSARRLLVELKRRGHHVTAATLQELTHEPTPGTDALRAAGITVQQMLPPENCDPQLAVSKLLRLIESDRPAAIVAWNALAEHKLRLADALEPSEGLRMFDVSPGEMFYTSLSRCFQKAPRGVPFDGLKDYGARLAGVIVKYASESERAEELGAPVHVIRNGVPLLPMVRNTRRDKLVFGTAARLHPHKRLDLLLAAFRLAYPNLPPCELVIAGETESDTESHLSELRALAKDLPIRFLGGVLDVPRFLSSLDVFVMISEPAGCPNASLEAMSAGLPVLATDHGGAKEQVIDQVTGRLVGREDVSALARAMVQAAGAPELRAQWGRAGRERIESEFSVQRMVDAYERVLGL